MNGIYKGKYLIGLYNKPEIEGNDEAVAILDNCKQLAAYMDRSVRVAMAIAARRLKSKKKDVVIRGRVLEMHFIEYDE